MAKYRITAPDGQTFDIEGEGTQEEALAHFQANYRSQSLPDVGGGTTEAVKSIGSGMIAAPVAGLAGIAGIMLPGPPGQGANWTNRVQQALTYEPRTQTGKDITNVVTYPFQKLNEAAQNLGGKTSDYLGPGAGAAVNTAVNMLPSLVSMTGGPKVRSMVEKNTADIAKVESQQSIKNSTLNEGRMAGYVVPPESIFRGLAGKSSLRQEAVARNQAVTNSLARKAIEVPEETPLSPGVIEAKIDQFSQPYKELAAINPTAAQTLERLKQARADANAWYRAYDAQPIPTFLKKAERFNDQASSLEAYLDTLAKVNDKSDLIPRLKEARVKIAKAHDVLRSLNLGSGDVDAHVIGNMFDKGKPLTGELQTIGKFDQAFRRYTTEASKIEAPGGSALTPHVSLGMGMGGHLSGVGWLPAGIPLMGGPLRSMLLSDLYQTPKTYSPGLTNRTASVLFNKNAPLTLSDLASMGALRQQE